MLKHAHLIIIVAVLIAPAVATAAPAVAAAAPEPTGAAALIVAVATAVAGLITALCAGIAAVRASVKAQAADVSAKAADVKAQAADVSAKAADAKAQAADVRATQATAWADRLANAQADGVVLLLSYPGATRSSRGLLEANGWRVAAYEVTQAELDAGVLLPGPHTLDDVRTADAIVIEGLGEEHMALLAANRDFRDNIRAGAGVAMYTGGPNRRYDLSLWGECDQGVTTPVTCEAAVRASLARRAATAARQGVRPGQLAAARQALVG